MNIDNKKYRIYIDEVGNSDLKSSNLTDHRFLGLTGVIFELDYVKNTLNSELEKIKQEYFSRDPDEPIIFHRKELVYKKPPFSILHNKDLEEKFNADFLNLIKNLDFKIISVLMDKQEHTDKYKTWKYDPYHYCMEIIVERFFFFLKDKNAEGDLMFEGRGGKEDMRLKNSFSRIYERGTHYITNTDLAKYFTSKQLKIKPKQANISGLQIADLLAHPVRRYIFTEYLNMKEEKQTFGDDVIEVIKSKFHSYNGKVGGYGIKTLP